MIKQQAIVSLEKAHNVIKPSSGFLCNEFNLVYLYISALRGSRVIQEHLKQC